MVRKCCVPCCNVKITDGIKMHVLPKDLSMRRTWCEIINRLDLIDIDETKRRNNIRVCDTHFKDADKFPTFHNKTNLKCDALPLIIPGSVNEPVSELSNSPEQESLPGPSLVVSLSDIQVEELEQDVSLKRAGSPLIMPAKIQHMQTTPKSKDGVFRVKLSKTIGVHTRKELTTKARKPYGLASSLKRIAKQLDFEKADNRKRLTKVLEFAESEEFLKSKVNAQSLKFIACQFKMQAKKPQVRRFSFEDKVFALSLLKQGPVSYRILRRTFALPSRKTLMTLLNKVPFNVGINARICDVLRNSVGQLEPLDRCCVVLFDEISLEPSLSYDRKNDVIVGFENTGIETRLKFADHALVIMLKGLHKKWKQPFSYYFSQGGFNSIELRQILQRTIEKLQEIGFKVVATICDQYSSNSTAIRQLVELSTEKAPREMNMQLFSIGGEDIAAIFDPPHLLKGLRNNLLKYDLKFKVDGIEKIASWKDIQRLYELDVGDCNTKMCYKLTDSHIYEDKMKKMKVKYAAQVFSHRVSSTLRWTSKYGQPNLLSKTAEDTADFVSLIDQLFDSVNASTVEAEHGKTLRCAVKQNSPHLLFWKKCVQILETASLQSNKGNFIPPTLMNWIKTLHGFTYIWNKMYKMGFTYLCTRSLNQDPLENFLGCIRSRGIRNVNPSCISFISSFKSLLVNNFTSAHSPSANCENDDNFALNSLELFLQSESVTENFVIGDNSNEDLSFTVQFSEVENDAVIQTHAGYIARSLLKKLGRCSVCFNQLVSTTDSSEHNLIALREYRPKALLRPKTQFRRMFFQMVELFNLVITKCILMKCIKKKLISIFAKHIFNPFLCQQHDIFLLYVKDFLTFHIYTYIKNINKILKGQISISDADQDAVKILARNRYFKIKGRNRKVSSVKKLN